MTKEEVSRKIEEIFTALPTVVSIEELIESYGNIKTAKGFKCEFHNEKSIGGFKINRNGNYFFCFSCGVGGNIVKYVSLKENISYFEAGIKLALRYGLLSLSEYQEMFGQKPDFKKEERKYKHLNVVNESYSNIELKRKQSSYNINRVYTIFSSFTSLTEEHYKHLKEERKLTDREIEQNKFFSMPETSIMKDFLKEVEKHGLSLNGVPGFFQKKNSKGVWEWKYSYTKGICMPFFNTKGEMIGMQVRKDKGVTRYIWFSSARAMNSKEEGEKDEIYNGYVRYGMTSGAPISEIYDKNRKKPYVAIGEGVFKILTLSKELGINGLALGGVNSQQGILERLESIISKYERDNNRTLKKIFLVFDADMQSNLGISKALNKLYRSISKLEEKYDIEILCWKEEDGKGIDDLIFNGGITTVKKYSAKTFLEVVEKYQNELPQLPQGETKYPESVIQEMFEKVFNELNS